MDRLTDEQISASQSAALEFTAFTDSLNKEQHFSVPENIHKCMSGNINIKETAIFIEHFLCNKH